MKNINQNETDINNKPESNQIRLGSVEIYEPELKSERNVMVKLNIPFWFNLSGRREMSEYKKIALEDLRIKASTFFELSEFLSTLMRDDDDYINPGTLEFINVSSVIGKGCVEAAEIVELEFKRYQKQSHAEPEVEQPIAQALAEHNLQIMANKISHILQSDKVSDEAKDAFTSIIIEAGNVAGIGGTHPQIIKTSLPLIINALNPIYSAGIRGALNALLDSNLISPIENELRQYEKRFDGKTESKVLDLSDSSVEDLAQKLSDVIHSPYTPDKIKGCIQDELFFEKVDLYTPENILIDLKTKLEK